MSLICDELGWWRQKEKTVIVVESWQYKHYFDLISSNLKNTVVYCKLWAGNKTLSTKNFTQRTS